MVVLVLIDKDGWKTNIGVEHPLCVGERVLTYGSTYEVVRKENDLYADADDINHLSITMYAEEVQDGN